MKRLLAIIGLVVAFGSSSFAQYPTITLRQMNEVPIDSLVLADSLQNSQPGRWTLQTSPYMGDTVTVVALCVVPSKILTFTAGGFTMLLYDTAATDCNARWGAVFVRVNAPADTAQIILDGFLNVEAGDIIQITGVVSEFPGGLMNSVTQFQPIAGIPITILGSMPLPPYCRMNTGDFYRGIFPGGTIRFSTGEPKEGMLVEFVNLTVNERTFFSRGTFAAVDDSGNQITMYDAARFFTKGHGGTLPFPGDSLWTYLYDNFINIGTRIDTLRGYITTVSGSENLRGYRIAPIKRGDVVLGVVLPSITQHRRNPIIVPSDSAARVSVRVTKQLGGFGIASVQLLYSLNNGPFVNTPMTYQASDTTYVAQIPQQSENTFVHYFIKARDSLDNVAILANSAIGGTASDTSRGFFFYTVLNRALTIRDIQYTPYLHGRSGYLGATVSVKGIVTVDTSQMHTSTLSNSGSTPWFVQDGTDPWSGIWFVPTVAESLYFLRKGDSVTVTGTVQEQFDVTRLGSASAVVHTSERPDPLPVVSTTGTFGIGVGNGTPSAEQWEGMLVRFNNVRVNVLYPEFNDRREFEIDDGSGPVRVLRQGRHTISNDTLDIPLGYTILSENDTITHVVGIIYYSFNKYKFVPRTNIDFGTIITNVDIARNPVVPVSFALAQNYPNPFNPSTHIAYSVPVASPVNLKIYNVLGQIVMTLVDEHQLPGEYTVRFDASKLSTGVYFYSLHAGSFRQVRKMMLLK
jgi:hypothetical protein